MSWLDYFSKLFEEKKEQKIESFSIRQLPLKIEKELKNLSEKRKSIKNIVSEQIANFNSDISEQIKILESIDLEKRKENEKIKVLVKENLKVYIGYLKKLIIDLKSIENFEPEQYLKRVNELLHNFNTTSRNTFEKSTILVGDELERTKKIIKKLLDTLNKLLDENKHSLEIENFVNKINDYLKKLEETGRVIEEIEVSMENLNSKIRIAKEKHEKAEKNISNLKSSREYEQDIKEKARIADEKNKIEKEIQLLKERIDIKALAKHFHHDLKKVKIINSYFDNFKSAMESDPGLEIIKIVKEARGMDINNLNDIRKKYNDMSFPQISEIDRKRISIENEIKTLKIELSDIENSISQEKKKREKILEKKSQIILEIKEQAKHLNILIID